MILRRFVCVWTGGVIYHPPPTLSDVLTPSILEGKGGNPVRGYPSILPCLLCLSCSLCFLNTIDAGTERETGSNAALLKKKKKKQQAESDVQNETKKD